MAFPLNRGKVILQNWDERQKELENLSGPDAGLGRSITMQKYVYLRAGLARLNISPTVDERIYAGIIKAMLKKMLKEFFPNLILRKINEWKMRYLIMPRLTKMSTPKERRIYQCSTKEWMKWVLRGFPAI